MLGCLLSFYNVSISGDSERHECRPNLLPWSQPLLKSGDRHVFQLPDVKSLGNLPCVFVSGLPSGSDTGGSRRHSFHRPHLISSKKKLKE